MNKLGQEYQLKVQAQRDQENPRGSVFTSSYCFQIFTAGRWSLGLAVAGFKNGPAPKSSIYFSKLSFIFLL